MFAPRLGDVYGESLFATVGAKTRRFLARSIRRKTLALRQSPAIVTFTFDDVAASACTVGGPILEQHGIRGTFYVAGAGYGAPSPGGLLASADQLRAIWANGHEIGCHTYSHRAVPQISLRELGAELDRNERELKKINSKVVARNFAYPYGDMSIGTKYYVENRFDSCRSVHAGINSGIADLGALRACPLEDASIDRSGIAALIARTFQVRGWLIFYSHDVAERPSRHGVTPALLEWAVRTARNSGCVVTTVAGALELIGGGPAAGSRQAHLSRWQTDLQDQGATLGS